MVPDITFKILEYYKNNREINEPFKEFVQRVGKEPFEVIVADLPKIGALGKETIDLYMDSTSRYSTKWNVVKENVLSSPS